MNPKSRKSSELQKTDSLSTLTEELESRLSDLFQGLAVSLENGDSRSYAKFQIAFIRAIGVLVARGGLSLSDVPKLLLDMEKLKAQDPDGSLSGKGDILRRLTMETVAK